VKTEVHAESAATDAEDRTRDRLTRLLLERRRSTVAELGAALGITSAAVRRHLDALLAEGTVAATNNADTSTTPRRRGRPARTFALTDQGRDYFAHAYDGLASGALRYLAQVAGPQAVAAFARSQVRELELRYRPVVAAAAVGERASALAAALSADGYAASAHASPVTGGEQLCQHHCPVAHVAAEFPQLCEAETEVFSRLLGTHVQRLATIAHGDGVCTTHVSSTGQFTDVSLSGGTRS
jgi:predicted ArsR family transcriptional regulator